MKEIVEKFMDKKLVFTILLTMTLSLIISLIKIKNLPIILISIAANIFLILIIKGIIKLLKVDFTKKEKIVLVTVTIIIYLFYFISVLTRKFLYYWDYSCYYNLQLSLEENFNISYFSGIKTFIGSTYSGEYGTFLSFFPEFIFSITNKTPNAYLLSCVLIYFPYILISFTLFIKELSKLFKLENDKLLISSIIVLTLFPIVHSRLLFGQPDIFGLAFVFLILALTINYDFVKIDIPRLFSILVTTFMLVITRRWYIYFVFSYYICYAISLVLKNIKNKDNLFKIIKNGLIFAAITLIVFLVTLFPLLKNILANDFSNSYLFYYDGGLKRELISQIEHLGYIPLLILLIGLVYGIYKKEYRSLTLILFIALFVIIFMFTRVQNMGIHHSLLLVPTYVYLIIISTTIFENKKVINYFIYLILLINFIFGIFNNSTNVFTDVELKTPKIKNYSQIENVSKWLCKNLNEENNAYMISHSNRYNPDIFRNFYAPRQTIKNYLPYGSAIIGVHKFPIELFTSTYIITTDPYEKTSLDGIYNDTFKELVKQGKFTLIKEFDMKDNFSIEVYKRKEEVDYAEVNLYKNNLMEETKDFKTLYEDILNNYIEENNLMNN